jgi:hypothetical protein
MLRDGGGGGGGKEKISLHSFVSHAQLKIVDNVCFENMVLSLQN